GARLDLTDIDPTQCAHVAKTADGNPVGPAVAAAIAQVHDVVAGVSAVLAGVSEPPVFFSRAASQALVELLGNPAVAFDLADTSFMQQVIAGAATRLGITLDAAAVSAAGTA